MNLKLDSKRAVVLGGMRGIGRAIAGTLADDPLLTKAAELSGDATFVMISSISAGHKEIFEPS